MPDNPPKKSAVLADVLTLDTTLSVVQAASLNYTASGEERSLVLTALLNEPGSRVAMARRAMASLRSCLCDEQGAVNELYADRGLTVDKLRETAAMAALCVDKAYYPYGLSDGAEFALSAIRQLLPQLQAFDAADSPANASANARLYANLNSRINT
jgi:hypothetical protein